jgi:uncharacterized protein
MHPSTQNMLSEITNRLVKEFHPEKIYLFGSYAWGQPDDDSDIDLLVVIESSQLSPVQRASKAYRCLRGTKIPVDVLVKTISEINLLHRVHASLISTILDEGTLIYG